MGGLIGRWSVACPAHAVPVRAPPPKGLVAAVRMALQSFAGILVAAVRMALQSLAGMWGLLTWGTALRARGLPCWRERGHPTHSSRVPGPDSGRRSKSRACLGRARGGARAQGAARTLEASRCLAWRPWWGGWSVVLSGALNRSAHSVPPAWRRPLALGKAGWGRARRMSGAVCRIFRNCDQELPWIARPVQSRAEHRLELGWRSEGRARYSRWLGSTLGCGAAPPRGPFERLAKTALDRRFPRCSLGQLDEGVVPRRRSSAVADSGLTGHPAVPMVPGGASVPAGGAPRR